MFRVEKVFNPLLGGGFGGSGGCFRTGRSSGKPRLLPVLKKSSEFGRIFLLHTYVGLITPRMALVRFLKYSMHTLCIKYSLGDEGEGPGRF